GVRSGAVSGGTGHAHHLRGEGTRWNRLRGSRGPARRRLLSTPLAIGWIARARRSELRNPGAQIPGSHGGDDGGVPRTRATRSLGDEGAVAGPTTDPSKR